MTNTEIANASKIMLGTTEAVAMYIGSTLIWQPSGGGGQIQHDYSQDYFTIESLEDNNSVSIERTGTSPGDKNMSYSLDEGVTWTDLTLVNNTNIATINTGDKILFKGINSNMSNSWDKHWHFRGGKTFKTYGNVMSLLFGDNFTSNSEFTSKTTCNFCGLFLGTTKLTDASNLILPALTCAASCYNGMFRGCTSLITAPALPATQSAQECYASMFEGCINLEEAPEINLTNLSQACCQRMFCMDRNYKITTPKMTKSPILRVATGATNCYKEMFKGNGNLVEVTCLMTSSFNCDNWLINCSSTGTFKKASSASWNTGTSGIPSGWAVETYVES